MSSFPQLKAFREPLSCNLDERLVSSSLEGTSASKTGISSPTPGSVTGVSVCCEAREALDIDINELFDAGRLDDRVPWSPELSELIELEVLRIDTGDDVKTSGNNSESMLFGSSRSPKFGPLLGEAEILDPQLDSVPVPVSDMALDLCWTRTSQVCSSVSSGPRMTTFAWGRFRRFLIFFSAAGSSGFKFGARTGSGSDDSVSKAPTFAR